MARRRGGERLRRTGGLRCRLALAAVDPARKAGRKNSNHPPFASFAALREPHARRGGGV